jgi:hypothetical protein
MDASSLARDLDNLEKSWSLLDGWLNFWTLLVVAGVGVELLVIVTEYIHDSRDFKRGTIHSPDKPSILVFGFGFIGAALVAIGVAGEFQVHVKAGKIESDMRSKSRELVAIIEREAGDANREAARLSKEAAGLKETAESERLARKQIEARLTRRFISSRDLASIERRLRVVISQNVDIFVWADDGEISPFALQVTSIFRSLHWEFRERQLHGGATNTLHNRVLVGTAEQVNSETKKAARILLDGLRSAGILATTEKPFRLIPADFPNADASAGSSSSRSLTTSDNWALDINAPAPIRVEIGVIP